MKEDFINKKGFNERKFNKKNKSFRRIIIKR